MTMMMMVVMPNDRRERMARPADGREAVTTPMAAAAGVEDRHDPAAATAMAAEAAEMTAAQTGKAAAAEAAKAATKMTTAEAARVGRLRSKAAGNKRNGGKTKNEFA